MGNAVSSSEETQEKEILRWEKEEPRVLSDGRKVWVAEGKASTFDGNEKEIESIRKKMQALSAERQAEKGAKNEEFLLFQKKYVEAVELRESLLNPPVGELGVTLPIRRKEEAKCPAALVEGQEAELPLRFEAKEEGTEEHGEGGMEEKKEAVEGAKAREKKEEVKEDRKENAEEAKKEGSSEGRKKEKIEEKTGEATGDVKVERKENVEKTGEKKEEVNEEGIEKIGEKKDDTEAKVKSLINELTPPILGKWLRRNGRK